MCVFLEQRDFGAMFFPFFLLPFGIMGCRTNGLTVEWYIFQTIEVCRIMGGLVFLQL